MKEINMKDVNWLWVIFIIVCVVAVSHLVLSMFMAS